MLVLRTSVYLYGRSVRLYHTCIPSSCSQVHLQGVSKSPETVLQAGIVGGIAHHGYMEFHIRVMAASVNILCAALRVGL